jgi:tetratricopeptide (TPR) repeat protein
MEQAKNCLYCGEKIPEESTKCPVCGMPQIKPIKPKKKSAFFSRQIFLVGIFSFFVLLVLIIILVSNLLARSEYKKGVKLLKELDYLFAEKELKKAKETWFLLSFISGFEEGDIKYHLGRVMQILDKRQKALRYFKEAVKFNPEKIEYHLAYINYCRDKGEDLERLLKKYLRKARPDDPIVRIAIGEIYYNLDKLVQAERSFHKVIKLKPDWPYGYRGLGDIFWDREEYDKAKTYYTKAIRLDSTYAEAYRGLGDIYYDLKEYESAFQNYTKAIKLDPLYSVPYKGLGDLYYQLNNYKEAIKAYTRAIELNPINAGAYYNRAWAYKKFKSYDWRERAKEDYEKACELDSEFREYQRPY